MAMSARAGALWELYGEHVEEGQGCVVCCSHRKGWRWVTDEQGSRAWKGPAGETAKDATAQHVMCGECKVDEGDVQRHRRMTDAVSAVARETQAKKRKTRQKKGRDGGRAGLRHDAVDGPHHLA